MNEAKSRYLREKADWVWKQTLVLHGRIPETRIASSLSLVEILTCLYYGGFLRFFPAEPYSDDRDRLIISKGHGAVALCPILADLGFFPFSELERAGAAGSFIGAMPDPIIPGFETVNGSLGHGLGVGCGIAVALKKRNNPRKVVVVVGDGEMHEGAVWEAVMFAGHHRLNNLLCIVDCNKKAMLGYTRDILDIEPAAERFKSFRWDAMDVNGHEIPEICGGLKSAFSDPWTTPLAIIAHTVKGQGVPALEQDPLCHVRSLSFEEIERSLKGKNADSNER